MKIKKFITEDGQLVLYSKRYTRKKLKITLEEYKQLKERHTFIKVYKGQLMSFLPSCNKYYIGSRTINIYFKIVPPKVLT